MDISTLAMRLRPLTHMFWLDSAGGDPSRNRFSFLGALPCAILEAKGTSIRSRRLGEPWSFWKEDPFFALEKFWKTAQKQNRHPQTGRPLCVGYLGYELGAITEKLSLPTRSSTPELFFASYDAVLLFDHQANTHKLIGEQEKVEKIQKALQIDAFLPKPALLQPEFDLSKEDYAKKFQTVREHILAGDIYQANLSLGLRARLQDDPFSLYLALRNTAKTPFGAFLDDGYGTVLSASMERFLQGCFDKKLSLVKTCPIKGTRPRGKTKEDDKALGEELLTSEKDRAEHIMIVDLERNDLGKVAKTGSVKVSKLATLCSYPTVHHLESTICASLRPEIGLARLLQATFPSGSITGAPKRRAMEIIAELEQKPRGVYCGSIGYLDDRGGFDFSIAIRTAEARNGNILYRAGGGLVIDSDEKTEWQECSWKAEAFLRAIKG